MRIYEIVYIFQPTLDETAVGAKLETYQGILSAPDGAEVLEVDHWGSRQLAYPIGGEQIGYYVVSHVRSAPEALPEFERVLKLDQELLRFLVVVNEGEPTNGASLFADRPEGVGVGRSEDSDEDEERSEEDDEGSEEDEAEAKDDGTPPEFSGGKGRRRRVEGPSIELLNYKDVATLSRFMTEEGKILPRRTTKVTAGFQRKLGTAVKRARFVGLVPYVRSQVF